jgi:hypothetical protein
MKRTLIILIFLLTFYFTTFAQSGENGCLEIRVHFPPHYFVPQKPEALYLSVGNRLEADKYEYVWAASAGKISQRHEKYKADLITEKSLKGMTIRVTVKVKGLPEGCSDSGFENGMVFNLEGDRLDDFGRITEDQIRGRFDNFFIGIQNNPGYEGLIALYINKDRTKKQKADFVDKLRSHYF